MRTYCSRGEQEAVRLVDGRRRAEWNGAAPLPRPACRATGAAPGRGTVSADLGILRGDDRAPHQRQKGAEFGRLLHRVDILQRQRGASRAAGQVAQHADRLVRILFVEVDAVQYRLQRRRDCRRSSNRSAAARKPAGSFNSSSLAARKRLSIISSSFRCIGRAAWSPSATRSCTSCSERTIWEGFKRAVLAGCAVLRRRRRPQAAAARQASTATACHCGISSRISMRRLAADSGSVAILQLAVGIARDLGDAVLRRARRAPACSRPSARARSTGASCRSSPPLNGRASVWPLIVTVPCCGEIALLIFSMARISSRRGTAEPISNMPKSSWSVTETWTPLSVAMTEMPSFSLSSGSSALASSCRIWSAALMVRRVGCGVLVARPASAAAVGFGGDRFGLGGLGGLRRRRLDRLGLRRTGRLAADVARPSPRRSRSRLRPWDLGAGFGFARRRLRPAATRSPARRGRDRPRRRMRRSRARRPARRRRPRR